MKTLIRCLARVDTMPKDGSNHGIKLPLREALEGIASRVFEYARLNDDHVGDNYLYYVHNTKIIVLQ